MNFRVGQKVIYVGIKRSLAHAIQRLFHPYKVPEKGVVYTVSNTYASDDEQVIELLEFPSPADGYWDAGFLSDAFRPAVDRKTDIAVFKEILRKATRKRSVDA